MNYAKPSFTLAIMKLLPEWNPTVLGQSPLFAPLLPAINSLSCDSFPGVDALNSLLDKSKPAVAVQRGIPLHFVLQTYGRQPFSNQYEPRCFLRGELQTRENNWHDLFNALVWLTFPRAKAAINARHYECLVRAQNSVTGNRSRGRDMLTLLDESGILIACADTGLENLLHEHEWKELFWHRRKQVESRMGFYLFGHSLYEKAMRPYIGMTGHGLLFVVTDEYFSWSSGRQLAYLDDRLAEYLADPEHCLNPREMTPVPLLGVPGWSSDNVSPDFYDNYGYFRRRRILSAQTGIDS